MNVKYILASLLGFGCLAHAALTPQDFAAGMPVRVADEMPVQVLTLPPEVYQQVQRPDLGDLRVFNADGDEVPHALLQADRRANESRQVPLRFFILAGDPAPEQVREQLELPLPERLPPNSIAIITSPPHDFTGETAYLLDASELGGSITALRLELPSNSDDFLTTLAVEVSDDLQLWRPLSTATVARLQREGNRLERTLISLPPTSAPYLRLTPQQGDTRPPLEGVQATLISQREVQVALETLALTPSSIQPDANRYTFNAGGFFGTERADLSLPQANTLVRAELFSSTSPDGPWTRRFEGLRYRLLQGGQEVTSAPMR